MMCNIKITFVPKNMIRNGGIGDYYLHNGQLVILIANTLSDQEAQGVMMHEIVEACLAMKRKISFDKINEWDATHLESPEPGAMKNAPYHDEHMFADKMMKIFMKELAKKKGDRNWYD